MGLRDIVKYVVACSGILKPIIAKWECSPPITTPNKATSSFSYTLCMSKCSTTCDHLYKRPPCAAVTLIFQLNINAQPLHLANTKMFVGRQCTVNETTMACNLFILKPDPTIVYLHTHVGH